MEKYSKTSIKIYKHLAQQKLKQKMEQKVHKNTRIYNLIFVLQITCFLLEDAKISNKANQCSGSTKQKRSNS